jgi:hypothetical protein
MLHVALFNFIKNNSKFQNNLTKYYDAVNVVSYKYAELMIFQSTHK